MNIEEQKAQFRFRMKIDMRWSDMDMMNHINNAVYLTYFEQARGHYFHHSCQWNWKEDGLILASAHVNYIRPLFFMDEAYIYIRTSKMGTKSFDTQYLITRVVNGVEEACTDGYTTMVMFDYKTQKGIAVPDRIRQKLFDYETVKF
jgi:acyl-CoA thioester hydrolase